MRVGLGRGSGEIYTLIAAAGEAALAVARAVEQRFLAWPGGTSQAEIKELEHDADHIVSELL